MAQRAIRFAVYGNDGRRGATWKCWTETTARSPDLFIACRELDGIHVSLHDSGHWHAAYVKDRMCNLFAPGQQPAKHLAVEWSVPAPIVDGITVACRVLTPERALTATPHGGERNIFRVNPPKADETSDVTLLIAETRLPDGTWPGKHEMETELVGSFELANGSVAYLVARCAVLPMPTLPQGDGEQRGRFFRGKSRADLVSGIRAIAFATENGTGVPVIYDLPVLIRRDDDRAKP